MSEFTLDRDQNGRLHLRHPDVGICATFHRGVPAERCQDLVDRMNQKAAAKKPAAKKAPKKAKKAPPAEDTAEE